MVLLQIVEFGQSFKFYECCLVVGIDLGIINLLVVVVCSGVVEFLLDVQGCLILFFVVCYYVEWVEVGESVCVVVVEDFFNIVILVKCLMGCGLEDVK